MTKKGYLKIVSHNFFVFKKNWISQVFYMLLEPFLFLSAFGYGIGQYINSINGQSYLEYFFIGYLSVSSAVVAFIDSFNTQNYRMNEKQVYASWLITPIKKLDIYLGETLSSAFKGLLSCAITCVVGLAMGVVESFLVIPLVLLLFISIFLFSALGSIVANSNFLGKQKIPNLVLLIPMILISGIFFPVQTLNLPLWVVSYLLPFTHSIQLSHSVMSGIISLFSVFNFLYLLIISYAVFVLGYKKFKEKFI